jgi:phage gp46-like protein
MTDIALQWSAAVEGFDLAIDPLSGDLVTDDGLTTAVIISLFTDARAAADDPLPDPAGARRGWWGDALIAPDRLGSLLWLLVREKVTAEVAARARKAIADALAWLDEDGIAAAVSVETEAQALENRIAARAVVTKPSGERVEYRWANLWEAIRAG